MFHRWWHGFGEEIIWWVVIVLFQVSASWYDRVSFSSDRCMMRGRVEFYLEAYVSVGNKNRKLRSSHKIFETLSNKVYWWM